MLQRSNSLVALILLSGTLALIGVACNSDKTRNQSKNTQPTPVSTASGVKHSSKTAGSKPTLRATSVQAPAVETASNQPTSFDLALDKADSAFSISQSAQSSDDWRLVASQWQDAIALMQTLPNNSPYKARAKTKINEYQQHLIHAQQQANGITQSKGDRATANIPDPAPLQGSSAVDIEVPPPSVEPQDSLVFQAAIERRIGGTPVIYVTFNGDRKVEMIVDTGASGTVLTQATADALGLVPIAKAKANTASAKAVEFPVGYVNSIQVGGAVVKDVPVAIAPASVLETGLLGHDFFGNYDVTIKRDVVEFRSRSRS
ncbi:MAG TPA: aspartyl protease [Cyanobacteria bacterium UBA11049]|nr:aspartyl protease [Cyanobacteria bacterium UBA11049]